MSDDQRNLSALPLRDLLQRAANEHLCLSLISYSGDRADLTEDDVRDIQRLIRDLAVALAIEAGIELPQPDGEVVF